jgi:hypothetical protein
VLVRHRRDGWTVEKQYAFIEALAETGIVEDRRAQIVRGTSEHVDCRRLRRARASLLPSLRFELERRSRHYEDSRTFASDLHTR